MAQVKPVLELVSRTVRLARPVGASRGAVALAQLCSTDHAGESHCPSASEAQKLRLKGTVPVSGPETVWPPKEPRCS